MVHAAATPAPTLQARRECQSSIRFCESHLAGSHTVVIEPSHNGPDFIPPHVSQHFSAASSTSLPLSSPISSYLHLHPYARRISHTKFVMLTSSLAFSS